KCEKPAKVEVADPKLKSRKYVSTVVTTFDKFAQRYGYFEARTKVPATMGMWPAFWMMPDRGKGNGSYWGRQDTKNGGMEIDIMEQRARFGPYRYNIAMHWDGYQKDHKSIGTERVYCMPDKDGFVTTGLLWGPGKLTFYCNGNVVGVWQNERIATVPGYLMFTLPTGGWGTYGNIDDTHLPAYFLVDYVRVWQNAAWAEPKK
ncbi:MAG: glycoside hydrolase family 16 protein, partial [Kiritimatiellaeota bacterium]|nr:glycoside hydrolase family 16 protein [Kiritimatiellota bacterium]